MTVVSWMLSFVLLTCGFSGYTQQDSIPKFDSTYIRSYQDNLMIRTFIARRYTNFNFRNNENDVSLRYSPNSGFALGVGASYKWATVNLSYAFDFLNPYRARGETRTFDFQAHGYGQKIVIDLLGQLYKGFYLPEGVVKSSTSKYYTRGDIRVLAVGGTLQYVFNNKRFAYRAAFMQNQWQRKSAGTLLAGMEVYTGRISGDSSLVPFQLAEQRVKVEEMKYIEIGPNVGYAYTWVYKERFYLSGSASVSVNAGYNRYKEEASLSSVVTISPNTLFRVSGGYAIKNWSFNLMFIATGLYLLGEEDNHIIVNSGDMRLNVNYRFTPNRRMKKYLKPIDKAADEIETILDGNKN